ncbi:chloroplast protein FOR GROWTH AND FERTILITY 2-like [Primulina huaijiensis]|uniref:chloroplast protein FOR GROWTH AND FERTILITY 2-like n=1 Tax=Primulina huaijiensis TaxID=1492673 RepID=UPI003CC789C9
MERLIHSKAVPHCNLKPSSSPLVFFARKMAFSSNSFRWVPLTEPLRINSLSCSLREPSLVSPETREKLSLSGDSTDGLAPKPHFRRLIPLVYSPRRKVVNAGAVILLSAILLTLLHPVYVPPAFASFPNAAKTGVPAAVAAGTSLIRSELLSSAWTGFFAGCLHTLSGPDHLAALAPLSIGCTRMESAAVGALWGCGHDAGQLIFGLLFLLLKDRLHIEILRTWGTRVVGFTLLVIGAMGIREASEVPSPCLVLENGEDVSGYEMIASPSIGKKKFGFTTFATGIVHGLQPDALMMILPALALPSRLAGAAFLFMFLVGTVFAMGSYTMFIGSCSQALKERIPRVTEKLTWASSLVAIGLGVAILISEFFGISLY